MDQGMTLRPIGQEDNQALYELIRATLEVFGLDQEGTAYTDPELAKLWDYYQALDGAEYFVLMDENGKVIGGAGYAPFADGICELQKLYLREADQGRGLGKKLLETVEREARKTYRHLYLETHSTLERALKLYENMDFQRLERPHPLTVHSAMDIWMIKDLRSKKDASTLGKKLMVGEK